MDASAEDRSKKIRKPYTITKSRESWTEPEHDKFLEALQLVGGLPFVKCFEVCWPIPGPNPNLTRSDTDMLAAIDDVIGDGVAVLSVSIGSVGTKPRLGRTLSPSGRCTRRAAASSSPAAPGTMGSALATASNLAPWVITVDASDIDRAFRSPVTLRSGTDAPHLQMII